MKKAIVCLSVLSFVACGKKGSDKNKTPTTPIVSVTPGNGDTTPDTTPAVTGPLVGLYLGTCEAEGSLGFADAVEVTPTHILPATVMFSSPDCNKDTLVSWGHTADFASFEAYAASIAEKSKADGDETVASFDNQSIKFVSQAGVASALLKTTTTLAPEKRFKIYVNQETVHNAEEGVDLTEVNVDSTASFSVEVVLTKGSLADDAFDLGLYCEDANKQVVRQESSFVTNAATGTITLTGKLNTWAANQVPVPTRCQVTLEALQKASGETHSHDVAWSQFIEVK